jgi:hypothetical protein
MNEQFANEAEVRLKVFLQGRIRQAEFMLDCFDGFFPETTLTEVIDVLKKEVDIRQEEYNKRFPE